MPRRSELRWLRALAGYAALVMLLLLVTVPLYHLADPSGRPAVIRLSATGILGVALIHLVKIVRTRIAGQRPSDFEHALEHVRVQPALNPHFLEWRDELRFSAGRQRYFERVLWPRLLDLATRSRADRVLAKPSGRSFRRGPSLTTLRGLVGKLEEHP